MITGSGQLASALAQTAPRFGWEAEVYSHARLEITDEAAVRAATEALRPELIMHTAALTRVAYCESHVEEATAVNANGTENVLAAAEAVGARLVYFSTDYSLSGRVPGFRLEFEPVAPLNIYGATKAIVEDMVQGYALGQVIRVSGVFGPRSDGQPERCFFRAIYERLRQGQTCDVVADQWTAVSYAPHLAEMLLSLQEQTQWASRPLLHLCSAGADSWYGWAQRLARLAGFDSELLRPISAADYPDQTPRPRHSALSSEFLYIKDLVSRFPAEDGLRRYAAYLASISG